MPFLDFIRSLEPLYVLCGVLVGGLVGMTGVGGGSLMTPLLILLFGVHPATAVGTDLLYAAATKTGGAVVHGWHRTIDFKVVFRLALGSIPATAATVLALYLLKVDSAASKVLISKILGVALFLTAISLLVRDRVLDLYRRRVGDLDPKLVSRLTVATGVVLGVLVTLSSVGAGAIGVTALCLLYPKMEARKIVGSDIAHAVPLTLTAGLGHSILGSIDWRILASLLVGSLPAVVVMSFVAARATEAAVRITLSVVLFLVCVRFWFF